MPAALDAISRLFRQHRGTPPTTAVPVAGDGSARAYHRLTGPDGWTAIGAAGPDADENRAFLSFTRALRGGGLPVPELYAADEPAGVWLIEDLGDTTLFSALEAARPPGSSGAFPPALLEPYRRVVEILPRFQVEGDRLVDYRVAYPRAAFDRQSILWDLNYFKYHFLKLAHVPFSEPRLERDFARLATYLLRTDTERFLYRDFQSRNILLREGAPWFIDYQGGRRGAPHYDIASLLYDAKADLPDAVRDTLLTHYLDALETYGPLDRSAFREHYRGYVIVRIMQAMGAYGYRGFFERKPHFLRSVPYAAFNIGRMLDEGLPVRLPEIERVFRHIVDAWARRPIEREADAGCVVQVSSFSYRHGFPEDASGHGGGFVFDCRALPNPGRLPAFATHSGRDPEVAEYLEARPELEPFWSSIRTLVDAQVEAFLARDFTSLSVAFGCTGGQHRSVYLAERLARHLQARFPEVRVRLSHREEPVWARTAAGHGG